MLQESFIRIEEYCQCYEISDSFINQLAEGGLIAIIEVENEKGIDHSELEQLEKWRRLHYELEINLPGLEAINGMLQKMEAMQQAMKIMENRLAFYNQQF